jgi:hypothetical protein
MTTAEDVQRARNQALEAWCLRIAAVAQECRAARTPKERQRLEAVLVAVALEAVGP